MKMAPNHGYILTDASGEPVSRTYQYRKVMKPMLERKRRARINRCLDELKELMTGALQTEGENVAKLEKADILELTVRHLHNIRRQTLVSENNTENTYADRFKAGFRQCAAEVTHFLGTRDQQTSVNILKHLNGCIKRLETVQQQQPQDSPQFTLAQQSAQTIQSIKQEVLQQQQQQQYSTTQTIKQEPQLTISKTTSTPPPWIKPNPSTTLIQQNYQHTNSYYNNNNNLNINDNNNNNNNNNNLNINDNNNKNNNNNNLVKHRHNLNSTILLSPKINVEDIPVWRPW